MRFGSVFVILVGCFVAAALGARAMAEEGSVGGLFRPVPAAPDPAKRRVEPDGAVRNCLLLALTGRDPGWTPTP